MYMTEKQKEEMKLMFSRFHRVNFWKVSETRRYFTCAVRVGREYSQQSLDKLVLHLFMNISTTVQCNKLEVILLNIISDITLFSIWYVSEVKKENWAILFILQRVKSSSCDWNVCLCVYMSKCILLAPSVGNKTAWQS